VEDGDEVLHVFGEDQAFGAVGGTGAKKELLPGLEEIDGSDLDRGRDFLVEVEDGLLPLFGWNGGLGGGGGAGEEGRDGGCFEKGATEHIERIYQA